MVARLTVQAMGVEGEAATNYETAPGVRGDGQGYADEPEGMLYSNGVDHPPSDEEREGEDEYNTAAARDSMQVCYSYVDMLGSGCVGPALLVLLFPGRVKAVCECSLMCAAVRHGP